MTYTALEQALYGLSTTPICSPRALPEFAEVHRELRRKCVTRVLLRVEYKAAHPEDLMHSVLCERYRGWRGHLDVVMSEAHRAGEKPFVDNTGQTMPVIDRLTGDARQAQIFVSALGASSNTPAIAPALLYLLHACSLIPKRRGRSRYRGQPPATRYRRTANLQLRGGHTA